MSDNQSAPEEFKDRIAPGKSWTEIVAWVGDLPPLPQVASRAIGLVEDPETTTGQLTDLLSSDTALAARVLKIANSAMFSRQREITTLSQAIMVIGFKALKGIIVAATLRQLNKKQGDVDRTLWSNSMCTAMASHLIATKLKKAYVDECFLLGLLHDLGKLVLLRQAPAEYKTIVGRIKNGETFVVAEQDVLGFAHPLIGALVAKKWNFSPEICQVILHHHDELDLPLDNMLDEKTAIVQLANFISHYIKVGHFDGYPEADAEKGFAIAQALGVDAAGLEQMFADVQETFEAQSSVFDA